MVQGDMAAALDLRSSVHEGSPLAPLEQYLPCGTATGDACHRPTVCTDQVVWLHKTQPAVKQKVLKPSPLTPAVAAAQALAPVSQAAMTQAQAAAIATARALAPVLTAATMQMYAAAAAVCHRKHVRHAHHEP